MNRKNALTMISLFATMNLIVFVASAQISVGVEEGDWVEYDVAFTGTPIVGHDATWARMEIIGVEGPRINVTFFSLLSDGTWENVTEKLDFEKGHLIDYFVIPGGLDESDVFFDENVGNISIDKVEVRTYVDAARTVVSGTTPETLWYWDQSTGVLVEAWSEYPEFTLTTIATKTGLWAPQIFGLEYPVFYALIIVSVAIAAIILVLIFRRKKGQLHQRNQRSLVEAGDPSS